MMSSEDVDGGAAAAATGGASEPFEMVSAPPPSSLPPPAPLPDFISAAAPSDPSTTRQPPPPPPSVAAQPGSNPFSIKASVGTSVAPMPTPPPVFNMPPPAVAMADVPPAPPPGSAGGNTTVAFDMGSDPAAAQLSSPFSSAPSEPWSGDTAEHSSTASETSQVWGWFKSTVQSSELLTKVAEKAKSSVDTMITTLDPQMKEFIASSGTIEVAVASDKEVKITAVKEGFRRVFKDVLARGLGAPGSGGLSATLAAQPVGFANGKRGAVDRINNLRQSGLVSPDTPIVAVESFLVETEPENFFEMCCIVIEDAARGISQHIYSQATPLPTKALENLRVNISSFLLRRVSHFRTSTLHTPSDYTFGSSGFAVTAGQAVAECLGVAPTEWHTAVVGVERRVLIANAVAALAVSYKHAIACS